MPGLTAAQLTTLKNDVAAAADTILVNGVATQIRNVPHTQDNAAEVAKAYNLAAAGPFVVYKTFVSVGDVGDKFNGTELAGLTTLQLTRLQTIAQFSVNGINPSLPDRRQFFTDVFSGAGGAITRPALDALWKRNATRAEKLFAAGTGSTAAPATLGWEGSLDYNDVLQAWAS